MIPIYANPFLLYESPGTIAIQLALVLLLALVIDRMLYGIWGWR